MEPPFTGEAQATVHVSHPRGAAADRRDSKLLARRAIAPVNAKIPPSRTRWIIGNKPTRCLQGVEVRSCDEAGKASQQIRNTCPMRRSHQSEGPDSCNKRRSIVFSF